MSHEVSAGCRCDLCDQQEQEVTHPPPSSQEQQHRSRTLVWPQAGLNDTDQDKGDFPRSSSGADVRPELFPLWEQDTDLDTESF